MFLQLLLDFIIDRRCAACGAPLQHGKYCICADCENEGIFDNPRLKMKNNLLEKRMWGLTSCKAAAALMPFSDDNGSRQLIHNLKYRNNRSTAVQIGQAIGSRVASSARFEKIDWVVPVPLHPDRQKQRGYNQAELVANEVAKVLGAKVSPDNLVRTRNNRTQTHRHRLERIQGVQNLFELTDTSLFENQSVLLVDDVFTTGSTIIECCKALDKTPNIKLYVYTIAAVI